MKSFLTDRPRVSAPLNPAPLSAALAPSPGSAGVRPASGSGAGHNSTVECVREGDRITRLIITCACGERTEIDCLYAPAG